MLQQSSFIHLAYASLVDPFVPFSADPATDLGTDGSITAGVSAVVLADVDAGHVSGTVLGKAGSAVFSADWGFLPECLGVGAPLVVLQQN